MGGNDVPVTRVITRLNVGGPARHVLVLMDRLKAYGFDTELIAGTVGVREGEIQPDPETTRYVQSLSRNLNPMTDVRAAREIRQHIERRMPKIVHTHMAKAGTIGRLAARRAGVPIILHTYHGHVLNEYFSAPVNRFFLEIERRLARISTALVAVSESVRDELLDLGVGRPEQWHVVPLGLELDHLTESALPKDQARETLGLNPSSPHVGIVGRIAPIKDHMTFLDACRIIADANPDVRFVVAGDGPLREEVEARAVGLLGDRVRFLGWVTDLPPLYRALDVVVLTSRNEGTPVALIEAASCERPVVATDVGGVADVVSDSVTGFLVPMGNAAAVAERVLYLLDHPDVAQAAGTAGRAHVKDRYASARLAQDVAGLYRVLLDTASSSRADFRRSALRASPRAKRGISNRTT